MHNRHVNTESAKRNTASAKDLHNPQESATSTPESLFHNPIDQIRPLVQDIETRACDIEILLETIFEKIDGLSGVGPLKTVDAINTLTTCALRNVSILKEHYEHISALTIRGSSGTVTDTQETAQRAEPHAVSFVDTYGATVAIPAGEVQDYAGIKAEQLRAVTQLLTGAASGGIDLSPSAVRDFSLMANSLAHEIEYLVNIGANSAIDRAEGGNHAQD